LRPPFRGKKRKKLLEEKAKTRDLNNVLKKRGSVTYEEKEGKRPQDPGNGGNALGRGRGESSSPLQKSQHRKPIAVKKKGKPASS